MSQEIKYQKVIPQTILTVISFIFFIFIYKIAVINTLNPHYSLGIVFIFPTVLFAILTFCIRYTIINRWIANIFMLIISVCSIFLTFIILVFLAFTDTSTTTDINKYERVLKINNYNTNASLKHFPKTLPKEAKKTQFFYTPQFLQGAEQCLLKLNIDSNYINYELQKFSNNCQWEGYILTDINNISEYKSYGLTTGTFHKIGYNDNTYKDSTSSNMKDVQNLYVYVLDSKPYKENNWNHGYTYGLAVDTTENAIVYFEKIW